MLTADKTLSTMAVRRFLQETGCPKCYIENAEYLEKFDPHGIYPTTIYGSCSAKFLLNQTHQLLPSAVDIL